MRFKIIIILVCSVLLLNGCTIGQTIKNNFQGTRYLKNKDYNQGESTFRKAVDQNADDPAANYYLGRFLLAQKKPKQALPYLQKAASIDKRDTDYLFWQGVALGELGKRKLERKSYQQVLEIDGDHLQALTYLGHNQFKRKKYKVSLATYQNVLEIWPESPPALYNRALIARILKQTPEEKAGWLAYLSHYPSGDLAIQATEHLNRLGDFSYRNHTLGGRTLTLRKIRFEPFSYKLSPSSSSSLDVVGATASNIGKGTLQVIVYQENDKKLARSRTISIKNYLQAKFPKLTKDRIGISWFDQPEIMKIQGKTLKNSESVQFFLTGLEKNIRLTKKKKM